MVYAKDEIYVDRIRAWLFSLLFLFFIFSLALPFVVNQLISRASQYEIYELYDDAIRQYKKILLVAKYNEHIRNSLAYAYQKKGDLEKAVQIYQEQVKINPDDPLAYFHLGNIFKSDNDYENAARYFEHVRRLQSLNGKGKSANMFYHDKISLVLLAECYQKIGEVDKEKMILEELDYFQEESEEKK